MEWTRSETLALAANKCSICKGSGVKGSRGNTTAPCNCVFRRIFRVCLRRFRECVEAAKFVSRVSLEVQAGGTHRNNWGRKDEEYIADFTLISKRILTSDEQKIFKAHFLLGGEWSLCCRQMKIDRGTFFHSVYRIEQKLGRAFREIRPYALFPLDEYFNTTFREERPSSRVVQMRPRTSLSSRVPLKLVA